MSKLSSLSIDEKNVSYAILDGKLLYTVFED